MDEARFELRHGTHDLQVFDEVVVNNQYLLPDSLPADSLIIDIGANVGAFAVACLLRGAGTVVCFEPSPSNFQQLIKNTSPWPAQVVSFQSCVWRSDIEQEVSFTDINGSAAGCCFPSTLNADAERVNCIGLDEVIVQCTNNGERRIQLLKIDAEFGEYPILYSAKRLDLVDEIIGEVHESPAYDITSERFYKHPFYRNNVADIVRYLKDNGFSVRTEKESFDNQINTLFFATRPTPETK